jgi:hypothetical protein
MGNGLFGAGGVSGALRVLVSKVIDTLSWAASVYLPCVWKKVGQRHIESE